MVGRDVNPVFGSYPSAIALRSSTSCAPGKLATALIGEPATVCRRLRAGHRAGVPLGLLIGRFRVAEAALGIYVTAGYAMPLVALVPLLVLWLGLDSQSRQRSCS